jgi:hypothetical protein
MVHDEGLAVTEAIVSMEHLLAARPGSKLLVMLFRSEILSRRDKHEIARDRHASRALSLRA